MASATLQNTLTVSGKCEQQRAEGIYSENYSSITLFTQKLKFQLVNEHFKVIKTFKDI